MVKFLIGQKVGMTQVFADDGTVQPVTVIEAGPCVITKLFTEEKDGYEAVQFGFKKLADRKVTKSKKAAPYQIVREVRLDGDELVVAGKAPEPESKDENPPAGGEAAEKTDEKKEENPPAGGEKAEATEEKPAEVAVGQEVLVNVFEPGEKVQVSGISKGKGFQGGVKRHGFAGRNATHGVKHEERTIGSVGSMFPQRVIKGRKMPGRMGSDRVTVKNLKVVTVDTDNNLLAVKGAVPGANGTTVEIRA